MTIISFLKKHPRLVQFLCVHETAPDLGVLRTWHGKEWLVSQCDCCGLIMVNGKPFRDPKEMF